ncbi:hypothetical protein Xmau_03981 [Xenorhabdus mauleonii]|uniref:Uncharacterized protein n=1 Tax=Xenorhabdus mauleonii TaxID=351675 RepID=A0A1I3TLI0_9GAMM|nr:hypothetical protein Xmau_03981 [Xenorhabdus mauleonii]SFJ71239.1 hypothetical protein SAMN05421680_11465 [Xenorhabdus mauleonii]
MRVPTFIDLRVLEPIFTIFFMTEVCSQLGIECHFNRQFCEHTDELSKVSFCFNVFGKLGLKGFKSIFVHNMPALLFN